MVKMSTNCVSNVVNVTESKFCTLTYHYDSYQMVSYEQDWTMSCKNVIELTWLYPFLVPAMSPLDRLKL